MDQHERELFISYDYDNDSKLNFKDLIRFLHAIRYPITIATYYDLYRFGTDTECLVSYSNLVNFFNND